MRISKEDRITEPTAKQIRQDIEGRRRIGCKDEPAAAHGPGGRRAEGVSPGPKS